MRASARSRHRPSAVVVGLAMGVGLIAMAPSASATAGDIVLASTTDAGVKGPGRSFMASLSADGSAVAFVTEVRLDPADTDIRFDVYVKNLASGDIVLASTSDTGVKSNGLSSDASLSADGRTVAFQSSAVNLDPGDTDRDTDVYVKDLVSGDIVLASTSDTGVKSNELNIAPSLSADASAVAFDTRATNLHPADTNRDQDVYVKDLVSGDIVLASTSDAGVKGNGDSIDAFLSVDGGTVAFESRATNLDPTDTHLSSDVYVKDLISGDIILASTSDDGLVSDGDDFDAAMSADSGTVVFTSLAKNLDPADTDINHDVYVRDLARGDIVLASTSSAGAKSNGSSFAGPLSADGGTVAFSSLATNFDPADTDLNFDVYLKDLRDGDVILASTSDAGVKGNNFSGDPSLSADGSRVAFESTAFNLDPADTRFDFDVYVKSLPAPISVAVVGRAVAEGDSGSRFVTFLITLSAPSPGPVIVDFATADGTARAGTDYRARSGTVTIAPGRMRAGIVIQLAGDQLVEPDETFTITLSNPMGATIANARALATIRNDDARR